MKIRSVGYLLMAVVFLMMILGGCHVLARYSATEGTASSAAFSEDTGSTSLISSSTSSITVDGTSVSATNTTLPPTTATVTTAPPTTAPPTTAPPTTAPPTTAPPTTAPAPMEPLPELSARTVFVYDTRSGEYLLLSGEVNDAVYPASVTKLFTTYVALHYLPLDTYITVGDELAFVPWDSSMAGLERGDVYTAEDLAYAALVVSGCDASYTLAAAAGRVILEDANASAADAVAAFMAQVNAMADDLGMENTNFVTPDGNHHDQHFISVQAYIIMARLCMEDADLARIVVTYRKTIAYTDGDGVAQEMKLTNTNEHLNPEHEEFYRECTLGLKTGYTSKAGGCFLGTFAVEGGYLVIGVFGCPNQVSRFEDTVLLLDYFLAFEA